MNTSAAIADPLLRQASGRRARLSDPHRTARVRTGSSGLRALGSRRGSATSRHTVMNNPGCRMLKQSFFSPSQPRWLLHHQATLSLPRQPCCPGTRRFPCSELDARDGHLVIRARLARLARKAGRVGSFIFVSRACRPHLAYFVHDSRTTNDETGLREHPE
jgi:hypothetical protein